MSSMTSATMACLSVRRWFGAFSGAARISSRIRFVSSSVYAMVDLPLSCRGGRAGRCQIRLPAGSLGQDRKELRFSRNDWPRAREIHCMRVGDPSSAFSECQRGVTGWGLVRTHAAGAACARTSPRPPRPRGASLLTAGAGRRRLLGASLLAAGTGAGVTDAIS